MMTPAMDSYGLCLDVWESEARKDSVAGHGGENWGFLAKLGLFPQERYLCCHHVQQRHEAADEAMNDIAYEIYKNAKG